MTAFDRLQSDKKLSDKEKRLMVFFLENKGFDLHKFEDWQYRAFRRSFIAHQMYNEIDRAYIEHELEITQDAHERWLESLDDGLDDEIIGALP